MDVPDDQKKKIMLHLELDKELLQTTVSTEAAMTNTFTALFEKHLVIPTR